MPQISPEFLIRSLQKLTNTQDDMQSLALFIRLNKTEHELMTNIYRRELEKSNIYHKLTLYYLANEIIQTERDTDNDSISLVNGIRKCVIDTFKHLDVAGDLKLNFDKLKSVWLKRKIFEEYEIGSFGEKTETNKFGREEFISRVNKYFDCQEEFVSYLTEFVDHINKK